MVYSEKKSSSNTGLYILMIMIFISFFTFIVQAFGSLATSSVKVVLGDCDKAYGIENSVINGNWFCSIKG